MLILDIYQKYNIPPNLIRHQLEVAAVGRFVCDHWQGEKINKELITKALLLHDMGNIIKFKRPFLGELEKDAQHWERVQSEFVNKYGSEVHTATMAVVSELENNKEILELIEATKNVWANSSPEASWDARVCEYADCCVVPGGIVDFEKRIKDLKERYLETDNSVAISQMRKNAILIEKNVDTDLSKLGEIDFSLEIEKLKKYEI